MPSFTYTSLKKFARQVGIAFRENILRESNQNSKVGHANTDIDKVRVSLNDLKIISSALLHFKKILLKKNELTRAKAVAEVDERIYQLIMNIEHERELVEQKGEGIAA